MSDTATADHPESLAMEKVHRELQVLRNRVEDLEDLRDLGEAIAENADKSLIPWVYAKKDLDLIDPFESTTRPKGCRFRASVPEIEYLRWTRRMTSARILLMRHAEKPLDPRDPELSDAGKARADALARYIPQDVAKPDFLFAPAASKYSVRPIQTLTPLSERFSLPLNTGIADQDYPVLSENRGGEFHYV